MGGSKRSIRKFMINLQESLEFFRSLHTFSEIYRNFRKFSEIFTNSPEISDDTFSSIGSAGAGQVLVAIIASPETPMISLLKCSEEEEEVSEIVCSWMILVVLLEVVGGLRFDPWGRHFYCNLFFHCRDESPERIRPMCVYASSQS